MITGPEFTVGAPDTTAEARLARMLEISDRLARVTRDIGPTPELDLVLPRVLGAMRDCVAFRGGSVCLVEDGLIRIVAADPLPDEAVLAARLRVGQGLVGQAVATGEPVRSDDLDLDPRTYRPMHSAGAEADMRSYLAVPLICLGETIGALQIDSAEANAFNEDDEHILTWLAGIVANTIASARRYQQVAQLERLRSAFTASVSHELRTPLTIVQGFLSYLARADELDPASRHDLIQRTERAAQRLGELVERVLTLSRIESGALMIDVIDDTPIREILESACANSIDPARVACSCEPNVNVSTDPKLLEQAVSLLLDNALKYARHAHIHADEQEIRVSDDGHGLPPGLVAIATEPFTRGHLDVPGMGIGLALARTIIEAIGGTFGLESVPGQGTVAIIGLPHSDDDLR